MTNDSYDDKIVTDRGVLRQVSKDTSLDEVEDLDLVNRLKQAMQKAWTTGCGLSAIQIGIPLRFSWFVSKGREYTLLNPKIIMGLGKVKGVEGCLSIPDKQVNVTRYYEIEYMTGGKKKRAKGHKARIVQHEIDHMNGILIDEREGL